jgi:enoyl-[acyl-carrier protein] reductase/trans-2-enoyl-CoA reductase (NAD+)
MSEKGSGRALVSVNKAVVTQASSAIPVVPLYLCMLFRIMKERGTHEGCIEQIVRLFRDRLFDASAELQTDEKNRIRIDDWEMDPDVQRQIVELWPSVSTENLKELTDFDGYRSEFLKLFGFGRSDVDYEVDVEV